MSCPQCLGNDVVERLRVDMDTLCWVDMYDCNACFFRWEEWSEPMRMADAAQ